MAITLTPKLLLPCPDGNELVSEGDNAITALALAIEAALSPSWVTITLLGSNYSARAGYFAPAYRLVGDGRVQLRGGLTKSTAIVSGDTLFTLPSAAQPTALVGFGAVVSRVDATRSPAAKITVSLVGVATVEVIDSQAPLSISFDGASFTKS